MLAISKRKTVSGWELMNILGVDWSFGAIFTQVTGKRGRQRVFAELHTSSANINKLLTAMPALEYRQGTVQYRWAPESRRKAILVRVW